MKAKRILSLFLAAVLAMAAFLACGASAGAKEAVLNLAIGTDDSGSYTVDLYGFSRRQYLSVLNDGESFGVSIHPSGINHYLGFQSYKFTSSSGINLTGFDGRCGAFAYAHTKNFYEEQYSASVLQISSIYGDAPDGSYGFRWTLSSLNDDMKEFIGNMKAAEKWVVYANIYANADFTEPKTIDGLRNSYDIANPDYKGVKYSDPLVKDINSLKIGKIAAQDYTGKARTPKVTVTDGKKKLTDGTDYFTSYTNNVTVGTATVTITGKGDYTGTKTISFKIAPKKVKLTAKTTGTKAALSWKMSSAATGYEIYRSVDGGKFTKVTAATKLKYTAKLASGKKYQFKVRPYAIVNGEKIYGNWSNVVKTK